MSRNVWLGHAVFAALIVAGGPALALMSPYYESATVLGASSVTPRSPTAQAAAVTSMVRTPDTWESNRRCTITVTVVDAGARGEPAMWWVDGTST